MEGVSIFLKAHEYRSKNDHDDDARDDDACYDGGEDEPFPERENECPRGHRVWCALFVKRLFRVGLGSESIHEGGQGEDRDLGGRQ